MLPSILYISRVKKAEITDTNNDPEYNTFLMLNYELLGSTHTFPYLPEKRKTRRDGGGWEAWSMGRLTWGGGGALEPNKTTAKIARASSFI
jgi:hypothetical protein